MSWARVLRRPRLPEGPGRRRPAGRALRPAFTPLQQDLRRPAAGRGPERGDGGPVRHRRGDPRGPRASRSPPDAIAGKPVDAPVPPLRGDPGHLRCGRRGRPPPLVPCRGDPASGRWPGNSNGGLYLVPGPLLPATRRAGPAGPAGSSTALELLEHGPSTSTRWPWPWPWPPRASDQALDVRWNTPSTIRPGSRPTPPGRPSSTTTNRSMTEAGSSRRVRADRPSDHHDPTGPSTACWPDGFPHSTSRSGSPSGVRSRLPPRMSAAPSRPQICSTGSRVILAKGRRGRQ